MRDKKFLGKKLFVKAGFYKLVVVFLICFVYLAVESSVLGEEKATGVAKGACNVSIIYPLHPTSPRASRGVPHSFSDVGHLFDLWKT